MANHRDTQAGKRSGERQDLDEPAGRTTEAYRDEDGVVFYDAENPLAWIQAAKTVVLPDAR
ncbi:MAG: hypothetical protein ABEJ06_00150 [Haloarculaceae archaeon]